MAIATTASSNTTDFGPVIDFRLRPFSEHYDKGFSETMVRRFFSGFGYDVTDAAIDRSYDSLSRELDEAHVVKAVLPGRKVYDTTNDELFAYAARDPQRFLVFPFLDVARPEEALDVIERDVVARGAKGVSIEPLGGNDVRFDDERIFPIYARLQELGLPVLATVSAFASDLIDPTIPRQIHRVVTAFPNLIFVAAHAGWPWVAEMVPIAFMNTNLYLLADFEGTRGNASPELRQAAERMIPDQVLFGSSFPLGPIAQGVQNIRDWHLDPASERKVLHDTAAKILGL
ncbi:amidohydrolase family protein [Bifidobacterium callimiconis]|uniref:Amidohydrolase 2 n=1 Tax=Bifidobacterium callimiconis TaxID=2306973 RepID=A0A430FFG3_9BIFI|nr:amidohydrolase family protein [Bifidobacterium callimiconis]RSX51577.1 amidohydrolase 2 [Bifidobacterium callimiconis]